MEALQWTCLQALLQNINKDTVLGYVQVADTLSDATLMAACIRFLTESDERYPPESCFRSGKPQCRIIKATSRPAMVCRAEVAKQDEMQSLTVNNPVIAQKSMVAVMDLTSPKKQGRRNLLIHVIDTAEQQQYVCLPLQLQNNAWVSSGVRLNLSTALFGCYELYHPIHTEPIGTES